ncbi:MAG: 50S ribosomal protein L18Ae [Haloferacaceae archaeon]
MSEFTVTGRFQGRSGYRSFEKTVEASNESVAREHIYSLLGSEHGLKRTKIELDEINEVTAA